MDCHSSPARARACLCASLVFLLAGCAVGPNFHSPKATTPRAWAGITPSSATQPSAAVAQAVDLARWWRTFDDPVLTSLVEQALLANLDVKLAQARLRQSRCQLGVAIGGLLPAVNATGSFQRRQLAGPLTIPHNQWQAGLDAAWELDVFGGVRRGVEAAEANVQATQEALYDTQVTLAAEVALDYVQLRGFQREIVIARENLKAQRQAADITRRRQAAGFVSTLDVANADAQVATTESTIPPLETSAQQSIYALSVLLGRLPAELLPELSPVGQLPPAPARLPVGLPSELLRRRPDIRRAEALLHAATAEIGVATADLFPRFSLIGDINWQANTTGKLFETANRAWTFGPTVNWSLFQGGATLSNIGVQEALRDQAFITWQQTVLTAFQDAENALIALTNEQEHRKSLAEATAANRKAVEVSTQLYTQGNTDFLNVLNAQRSLLASEDALVQSQRNVAADIIALYKAVGGGWEEPSHAATRPTAASGPATMPARSP